MIHPCVWFIGDRFGGTDITFWARRAFAKWNPNINSENHAFVPSIFRESTAALEGNTIPQTLHKILTGFCIYIRNSRSKSLSSLNTPILSPSDFTSISPAAIKMAQDRSRKFSLAISANGFPPFELSGSMKNGTQMARRWGCVSLCVRTQSRAFHHHLADNFDKVSRFLWSDVDARRLR